MNLPRGVWLIAPYAAWMALMAVLPATVGGYAVRTAVVAVLLAVAWRRLRSEAVAESRATGEARTPPLRRCGVSPHRDGGFASASDYGLPIFVGFVVFAVWILPEQFDWFWYRRFCIVGEGGTQAVAEASAAMIAVRLVGSAFVISVAEELFFRKWLISFAGFGWMVALFAIEHDRWLVGAIAGVVYGLLYLRKGLFAAVVAHAVTNLVLGLWVLKTGQWQFW